MWQKELEGKIDQFDLGAIVELDIDGKKYHLRVLGVEGKESNWTKLKSLIISETEKLLAKQREICAKEYEVRSLAEEEMFYQSIYDFIKFAPEP